MVEEMVEVFEPVLPSQMTPWLAPKASAPPLMVLSDEPEPRISPAGWVPSPMVRVWPASVTFLPAVFSA